MSSAARGSPPPEPAARAAAGSAAALDPIAGDGALALGVLVGAGSSSLGPHAPAGPGPAGLAELRRGEPRCVSLADSPTARALLGALGLDCVDLSGAAQGTTTAPSPEATPQRLFTWLSAAEFVARREALAAPDRQRWAAELAALGASLEAALLPSPAPRILAVINLTPDSFSDGGRYASSGRLDVGYARDQAMALLAAGAAGLDVGGESTRPGAEPVDEATELARVLPLLEALQGHTGSAILSIDTQKARVAELALERGAHWINDVSAGTHDPAMLALAAKSGCQLVLMHRRGSPRDMQRDPRYQEPVAEVAAELRLCLRAALEAGVERQRILLDPGIGFGKRLPHNLALLARLGELRSLGAPLLLGASRKSFLGQLSGQTTPALRLPESLAAASAGALVGAAWLRVHDVAETRAALSLAGALAAGIPSP